MIGKFNVRYGEMTVAGDTFTMSFSIPPESRFKARQTNLLIKNLISEGKSKFILSVDQYRPKRSLDQNALMWALLEIMANNIRSTTEECYIQILERYGYSEYLLVLPETIPALRSIFRTIKEIGEREVNGKQMKACRCFFGSSTYDTKQMSRLIDGIFDELKEMGVSDEEVGYYRDEWENKQTR
jgi:hypothetical protein